MADETTGIASGDGEATPKVEPNISVQETTSAPLVGDTTETTQTEQPAEDTTAEANAAQEEQPGRKPVQKLPDWAQKKMNEIAASEREARRLAKQAQEELAALKTSKPATPTAQDEAAASANAPAGGYKSQADFDAAVQAEANRRDTAAREQAAQADFNTKSNAAYEKGIADFGEEFKSAVGTLQQIGVMEPDFVGLVLETDNPAQVLMELGADPAKAVELMGLPPAKRAIEVARLSIIPPKKAAEPLSKAPKPVTPVEGTARPSGEPRDDDDDQAWFQKRIAQKYPGARA